MQVIPEFENTHKNGKAARFEEAPMTEELMRQFTHCDGNQQDIKKSGTSRKIESFFLE